jgi:hypothetical protein
MIAATLFLVVLDSIGSLILPIVLLLETKLRARGSVDRASGSGPEERGFESLRAHTSKSSRQINVCCFFVWSC